MSVYWARGSKEEKAAHGYFLGNGSVTLIRSRTHTEVDPLIVIDHELTHAIIYASSSLGMIEFGLVAARTSANTADLYRQHVLYPLARTSAVLRISTVQRFSEYVHEAVAWYVTEGLSSGLLSAPRKYRKLIDVIRGFAGRLTGLPSDNLEKLSILTYVAQAVAAQALSPRCVGDVLAAVFQHDDRLAVRKVGSLLQRRAENPSIAFRHIFRSLAFDSATSAHEWATSILEPGHGSWPHWVANGGDSQTIDDLARSMHGWMQGFAFFGGWSVPHVRDLLETHRREGFIDLSLDPVPQTCILGDHHLHPDMDHAFLRSGVRARTPPIGFEGAGVFVVSRARSSAGTLLGGALPDGEANVVVILAVRGLNDSSASPYVKPGVWLVDAHAAHAYLAEAANSGALIVAEAHDYDFQRCDFRRAPVLRDIPHSVLYVGSFYDLWRRLAIFGIGGCGEIALHFAPSEIYPDSRYGYFALAARHRSYPKVVFPVMAGLTNRYLDVTNLTRSPTNIRLVQHRDLESLECLGSGVKAAGQAFEYLNM